MRPRFFIVLVALACLLSAPSVRAQTVESPSDWSWSHPFKHLLGSGISGVYDPAGGEWNWAGVTIAAGAATTSVLFYELAEPNWGGEPGANHLGSANEWISLFGGVLLPLAAPAGFGLAGLLYRKDDPRREAAFGITEELAETLFFSAATAFLLSYTVGRRHPDGTNHSFPSGHTTLAFSAAGTLAYNCSWYVGVPALIAAGLVGFSRVDKNVHFFSDVAAGAGIGLFFATGVAFFHDSVRSSPAAKVARSLSPWFGQQTVGLSWASRF